MGIQLGDMLYDPATKHTGMVVKFDPTGGALGGWVIEWSNGESEYLWDHTIKHFKTRWEWLKTEHDC